MDAKNTAIGSVHTVANASSSIVNTTQYSVMDIQFPNRFQVHLNSKNTSCAKYFILIPS
jgi:hypothetical protein